MSFYRLRLGPPFSVTGGGDYGSLVVVRDLAVGRGLVSVEGRVIVRSVRGDSCEMGLLWGIHERVTKEYLDSLPRCL